MNVNKRQIWFMRQAGRYLPEYREIRKKKPDFLDLCFSPNLAAEISLQPIKRFDFDFIILFSDILVIPYSMNQKVSFLKNHGPFLDTIKTKEDLCYRNYTKCLDRIKNIFETIQILQKKKGNKKLIGFCGGPFTVLNYMIEGGTSLTHSKIKNFVKNKKQESRELIKIITELSVEYLKEQIKSGVDYVQIFESWASLLDREDYDNFVIEPNKYISQEIKKFSVQTQIIHFPRGSGEKYLDFIEEVKCDVISIDQSCPEEIIVKAIEKDLTVQGDLSPLSLLEGGEVLNNKTLETLEKYKNNKHIFNLSHGILPKTPIENVKKTVNLVRNYEPTE